MTTNDERFNLDDRRWPPDQYGFYLIGEEHPTPTSICWSWSQT